MFQSIAEILEDFVGNNTISISEIPQQDIGEIPNEDIDEIPQQDILDEMDEIIDDAKIILNPNENKIVKNYMPGQEEVNEIVEENQRKRDLSIKKEIETKKDVCGTCQKFQRQTANQRSLMGYCLFNGYMVLFNSTPCNPQTYRRRRNEGSGRW